MSALFIKWVGGKTKVLPILDKYFKTAITQNTNYIEPFVGGGSCLFHVLENYSDKLHNVFAADKNPALVNAYNQTKLHGLEIAERLKSMESDYISKSETEREKIYLEARNKFNQNENHDTLENAILFFFLNKTSFNGLYRVNKNTGRFNAPFAHRNQRIIDKSMFMSRTKLLEKVDKILLTDFEETMSLAGENTVIYLDPPYLPYDETGTTHQSYTQDGFTIEDTNRLLRCINEADRIGAKIILSQSYSEDVKNYLTSKLNDSFNFKNINFYRSMDKKYVGELIVSNFNLKEIRKSFI